MERILTVGGARATRPVSDFLTVNDYQGPKAGTYYVDLNVAASGAGSPDHPLGNLAAAITASNASIGLAGNRWWARRNRIFVCGDGISEDLTVLPEKCDIIGCGSDLYPFPRVIGHHIIALAKVACRFINMGFQNDAATPLFIIPAGCHGLQFLGGIAIANVGGSTIALQITDSACIIVDDFRVVPTAGGGDFAQGISILGTVGHEIEIKNCRINATEGITVQSTIVGKGSIILGNIIKTAALTINDDSDDFQVVDNKLMTDIDIGTTTAGYDFNLQLASGNKLTGLNGIAACVPFEVIAE